MQTRLLWRRSATAIGLYGSVALGLLGGLVAARELHPDRYGLYSLAVFGAGFFQVLLDLTVEEAMIKYGFRYTTTEEWGKLRRLYRRSMMLKTAGAVLASLVLLAIAPFADELFSADGLTGPYLLAALLPISFIPEAPAGAALVLDGRYEVRAVYNFLTALLRTIGLVIGAHFGVTEAILGLVLGQFAGSALGQRGGAPGVQPLPARAAGAARRRPPRDRPVRDPLEHRIDDRLGPGRGRALAPGSRLRAAPGRLLPGEPGAADRPDGADRARAADPGHGADARLGSGGHAPRLQRAPALQHGGPDHDGDHRAVPLLVHA